MLINYFQIYIDLNGMSKKFSSAYGATDQKNHYVVFPLRNGIWTKQFEQNSKGGNLWVLFKFHQFVRVGPLIFFSNLINSSIFFKFDPLSDVSWRISADIRHLVITNYFQIYMTSDIWFRFLINYFQIYMTSDIWLACQDSN